MGISCGTSHGVGKGSSLTPPGNDWVIVKERPSIRWPTDDNGAPAYVLERDKSVAGVVLMVARVLLCELTGT
jgi:hypothetical protein